MVKAGGDIDIYRVVLTGSRIGHLKRIRISRGSMISSRSHTKRISRIETPSHRELIPRSVLFFTEEPVFREIM